MATILETLAVKLEGQVGDFIKGMSDADKKWETTKGKFESAGSSMQALGGNLTKYVSAPLLGVAGVAVGAGAAFLSMQGNVDDGVDAIIVGTGASGEALDSMSQSMLNLKASSAGFDAEYSTIGGAIAEVNTRLGLQGAALESVSGDILKFSRLTGTDAVGNVQSLTRVMGDWGVENEGAGATLDMLFGAGQAFGIGMDSLSGKLVQFGAPLRQMGFGLEESAALFGKWEKEGVNAELAVGSLRIAAGKFARDNIPLREGLDQTMEAIKGATNESDALAIAMDVFGARAGPDMAAAIREGRFELEGAIGALRDTQGGLNDAAERTIDFREKWQINMVRAQQAMLPLGDKLAETADRLMPSLEQAVDKLLPHVDTFADKVIGLIDWFLSLDGSTQGWIFTLGGLLVAAGPVVGILGTVVSGIGSVIGVVTTVSGLIGGAAGLTGLVGGLGGALTVLTGPIGLTVAAAAGLAWAWNSDFLGMKTATLDTVDWVRAEWPGFVEGLKSRWENFTQNLPGITEAGMGAMRGVMDAHWQGAKWLFEAQADALANVLRFFGWEGTGTDIIEGISRGIRNSAGRIADAARDAARRAFDAAKSWLGIGSPSKRFMTLGEDSGEGYEVGFERSTPSIGRSIEDGLADVIARIDTGMASVLGGLEPAPAAAGGPPPINQVFNFYGPADRETVKQAAGDGVRETFRQRGMK